MTDNMSTDEDVVMSQQVALTINDMVPDEILFTIFQFFFSLSQDNITAMFVCKRWYNLLDELLKRYDTHTARLPLTSTDKYILGHLRVKTFNLIANFDQGYSYGIHNVVLNFASPSVEELRYFEVTSFYSTGMWSTLKDALPKLKLMKLYGAYVSADMMQDGPFFTKIPEIETYWTHPSRFQKVMCENHPNCKVVTKLEFDHHHNAANWDIDTIISDFNLVAESQSVQNPTQFAQFNSCLKWCCENGGDTDNRVLQTVLNSAKDLDRDLPAMAKVALSLVSFQPNLDYFIKGLPEQFSTLLYHQILKVAGYTRCQILENLIRHKIPSDTCDKDGNIPLHIAIKHGGVEEAKKLIEAGDKSQLLVPNKAGVCPYHNYSFHIPPVTGKRRYRYYRYDPFAQGANPGIQFFLSYYPDIISRGFIHLMLASGGDERTLKQMHVTFPDCLNYVNEQGIPALHALSTDHQVACLQIFISDPNVDLDITDPSGRTALMVFLEKGYYDLAFTLLECNRVDLDRKDKKGRTVLHLLAAASSRSRASASKMSQETKANWISFLVDKGLKLDEIDESGNTPFHYAVKHCEKRVIEEMINLGADINDPFPDQVPLLTHVTTASVPQSALTATFTTLIKNGASLNSTDKEGNTILHIVCTSGNGDLASAVLKDSSGMKLVNVRNKMGLLPIQICLSQSGNSISQCFKAIIKCKQTDYTVMPLSQWGQILEIAVNSDLSTTVVILDRLSTLKTSSFPTENSSSLNPNYPAWMQPVQFPEFGEDISILHASCFYGSSRIVEHIFKNKQFQEFVTNKITQGTSFATKLSHYLQLPELQMQSEKYKGSSPLHAIFLNSDMDASDQTKLIKLVIKYADGKSINWEQQQANGESIIELASSNPHATKELAKFTKKAKYTEKPAKRKAVAEPEEPLPRKRRRNEIDYSVFDQL